MGGLNTSWLAGTSSGVYACNGDGQWQRLGAYQFRITAFCRSPERLLAATGSGLWQIREGQWLQLHDETLTEVMDVGVRGEEIVAASAYGMALSENGAAGPMRWRWPAGDLSVNERFANALALADERVLVGSEGGVLAYSDQAGWRQTSLRDVPVRCLATRRNGFYAGTDAGLFASADGESWQLVSEAMPVYCFAEQGGIELVGTERGIRRLDGGWRAAGLDETRISAVAIDPADEQHWLAGACPGGLWETRDGGASWSSIVQVQHAVEAIASPWSIS